MNCRPTIELIMRAVPDEAARRRIYEALLDAIDDDGSSVDEESREIDPVFDDAMDG